MTQPIAKPPRKNPLARMRRPALPPGARSRTAMGLVMAAAQGRFMLQRCAECAAFTYPPRDACPHCLSSRLVFEDAPDRGVLLTETTVRVPSDVYFRERAPWRIGIVGMDCGPRIIAHLHEDCREGEAVAMSLQLDKSGQAVAFANPPEKTAPMQDDKQWREMTADPKHRRALVTEGRSAIGQAVARALLQAGASTVFLGVAQSWKPFAEEAALRRDGIEIVPLDLTDGKSVTELAGDIGAKVDILVNTAAHIRPGGILDRHGLNTAREEIDVAYLGLMRLAQAFGPIMRARGADGVISAAAWVDILSVYALAPLPAYGAYSASQAACLALGRSLRAELRPGGVKVVSVFTGPLDTEWFQTMPPPKVAPRAAASAVVAALQKGLEEVFVGDVAEDIRQKLAADPKALERELADPS